MFLNDKKILSRGLKTSSNSDTKRSLHFVSCDHPHTNACIPDSWKTLLNILLELVLNSSNSQKFHIVLKGLNDLLNRSRPVYHSWTSIIVLFFPVKILFFSQVLLSQNQCSKPFSWKIFTLVQHKSSQSLWYFVFHYCISSF